MKIYMNGTSGIKDPVDFDGNKIKAGDELTYDYLDPFFGDRDMSNYAGVATYKVKHHESGGGLYAVGINKKLYLHDFRFKYCKVVK